MEVVPKSAMYLENEGEVIAIDEKGIWLLTCEHIPLINLVHKMSTHEHSHQNPKKHKAELQQINIDYGESLERFVRQDKMRKALQVGDFCRQETEKVSKLLSSIL